MASVAPVVETTLADLQLLRRGKVRDVYAVDEDRLLIVATDRISAFDSVSPTPIERKGEVLTALSRFWFAKLGHVVPNHLLTTNIDEMPEVIRNYASQLRGRSMLVRRTEVLSLQRADARTEGELGQLVSRVAGHADHKRNLGFAAEHQLAEADQEIGQPERRHEQDNVRLIDQRP